MKKNLFLYILLIFATNTYCQSISLTDDHSKCGHDLLPQKYKAQHLDYDHEQYAQYMEVLTKDDIPEEDTKVKSSSFVVSFRNVGQKPVDLYWAHRGKLYKYREIRGGQSYQQSTHVGHKWVLKDRDIIVGSYIGDRSNPYYVVSAMDDSCFEIPVDLVAVYRSNGTGNESESELYAKMDRMNQYCENSNLRIRFKIARFQAVYSDEYYSIPLQYDKMTELRDRYTSYPKAVPLIQAGDVGTGGIGGIGWLAATGLYNETVWLHEIGHFLGLAHTHDELGEGKELVNGSNCSVAGDLICDTPATPNTRDLANDCIYSGTERDPNGQLYNPDVTNVMASADCPEGGTVSYGQEKRMLFYLRNNYPELNPCAAPAKTSDCRLNLSAGSARDIGSGGGQTFMVATNGQVFRKVTTNWQALPYKFEGAKIDVTDNGIPWVVTVSNRIYYYANNKWVLANGGGIDIACGGNKIYVIGTTNRIYQRVNNEWTVLSSGSGKRIDVGENGRPWMIGMNDQPFEYINNTWQGRGGEIMQDIAVADRGESVYGIAPDGTILEHIENGLFGPTVFLENRPYSAKSITIESYNKVWTVDESGRIYHGSCDGKSETESPAILSEGTYSIISKLSNKAVSLDSWNSNSGGNVHQWSYVTFSNQKWILRHLGDNVYTITSQYSNNALDVAGVSANNGANVHQWRHTGGNNQKWKIQPVGDGYYRLLAVHSGKALSINRNLTTNGANLLQWDYVGVSSQKWRFDELQNVGSPDQEGQKELSVSTTPDHKVNLDWHYEHPTQLDEVVSYTLQHYDTTLERFVDIETKAVESYDEYNSAHMSFTHHRPTAGENYYQVRIDFASGVSDYSAYETIELSDTSKAITIAPNPAINELRIDLSNHRAEGLQYYIVDPQGKKWNQGYYNEGHSDIEVINLADYPNGLYYIYIKPDNSEGFSQQFVKMK